MDANDSGEVGTEVGLVIRRDPDQVRAPDVYFLRKDRLPNGDGEGFLEVAPDLVVEVLSDSDTLGVIRSKVNDYFAIGTPLVWLVSPEEETVEVRAPDGPRKTLQKGDRLENFPSLPGFSCSVADLFA
ncbi:MAG: Uma2 family endonuclease [Meiothermus sp.]